ncbi:hypothetical protein Cabys_3242 [Caldithrix abyssi DSM 13497]|uniref:Uncharacterized protein n=1 Tax=Caldithrix abyssi DSM 13497 TaxID=880073 RepID=A0A1J1CBS5_CALAY|nr:hypothetical protein Cabys_3242 [Caldithrix abyssi DSM 13497]
MLIFSDIDNFFSFLSVGQNIELKTPKYSLKIKLIDHLFLVMLL